MSDRTARVLVLANQKGGVGKTTTAINLGTALAAVGEQVLLVDLDPQGNASTGLGVERKDRSVSTYHVLTGTHTLVEACRPTSVPNLWIAPSTMDLLGLDLEIANHKDRAFKLRHVFDRLARHESTARFSYVLVDCPPSLNLLTINAMAAADSVLVPLQCEFFALEGLSQLLATVEQVKQSLNPSLSIHGILLTMFDPRNNLATQVVADVREIMGEKVYETVIPRNVRVSEAPSHGKPVLLYDLKCAGSQAYLRLASEVIQRERRLAAWTARGQSTMAEEHVRPRLGRGLAALIADSATQMPASTEAQNQRRLPVGQIRPNPRNPRRHFNSSDLADLSRSIAEKGMIQPILVRAARDTPDHYEIIAGERRWRAAEAGGLRDVPVLVIEATDKEALEIAIVENIQRADLNAMEEARGYERLVQEFGYAHADLARIIGRSRSHVANMLRLLRLPPSVETMVAEGALTAGHARALLSFDDPEPMARRIVARGLSVRDVERLAQAAQQPRVHVPAPQPPPPIQPNSLALASRLSDVLGLRVSLEPQAEGGELRIRYRTLEELENLCRQLIR